MSPRFVSIDQAVSAVSAGNGCMHVAVFKVLSQGRTDNDARLRDRKFFRAMAFANLPERVRTSKLGFEDETGRVCG